MKPLSPSQPRSHPRTPVQAVFRGQGNMEDVVNDEMGQRDIRRRLEGSDFQRKLRIGVDGGDPDRNWR